MADNDTERAERAEAQVETPAKEEGPSKTALERRLTRIRNMATDYLDQYDRNRLTEEQRLLAEIQRIADTD